MSAKRIHFRSEAREKVLRGAAALADAVRVTLGPKARCVLIERKWGIGFDAARAQYVDLIEAGIVDPVKVVRLALENAVSVASTLLLAEATLTEIPEKHREAGLPSEAA